MILLGILSFTALIMFWAGKAVTKENASFLLNGYNTMSEEQKANFDLDGYLSAHRKFFPFLSISMMALAVVSYFIDSTYTVSIVVIYMLLAFIYFFLATRKYDRNRPSWGHYSTLILLIGATLLVVWLSYQGFQEDTITISQEKVTINGLYNKEIQLNEIDSFAVLKEIPSFPFKSNGLGMGNIKKGYFRSTKGDRAFLSIQPSEYADYLYIQLKDGSFIYLNSKSQSSTHLYHELAVALQR